MLIHTGVGGIKITLTAAAIAAVRVTKGKDVGTFAGVFFPL